MRITTYASAYYCSKATGITYPASHSKQKSQNQVCVVLKYHSAFFFNFVFRQVSLDEYMGVMLDLGWAEPGKVSATVSLSAYVSYDLK